MEAVWLQEIELVAVAVLVEDEETRKLLLEQLSLARKVWERRDVDEF